MQTNRQRERERGGGMYNLNLFMTLLRQDTRFSYMSDLVNTVADTCVKQYVQLGQLQLQAKSAQFKDSIPGGDETTQ